MKKKTASISLSTILIIGLLVFLLLRSQKTNAATTASNASDENAESDNASSDTAIQNPYLQEKDPAIDSAIKTGTRIGNHSWPSTKSETADARQGWNEAVLFWDDYTNATSKNKQKMKNRVGYVILSCIEQGCKGETFNQRYKHLTDSSTYEYKNIYTQLTEKQKNSLKKMNSFAISDEYTRWYQQME